MSTLIIFNKQKKSGVSYLTNQNVIRKFVFDSKKYKLIKNEIKGFEWYQSRYQNVYKSSEKIIRKKREYIDFPIIKGREKKFWDYLYKNYDDSEAIVNHYKKIWPNKKKTPCHGDLTISNVIFKNDYHPFIIDWENFSNKKMFWGFDLSYFLISTVSLPSIFHKDDEIKNSELLLLEKLWKKAFKNKNIKYLNKQVNYLKSKFGKTFIFRNYFDYYPNLLSKKKIDQLNAALKLKI